MNVLRPSPGGLLWNPALARYVSANGRIVSTRQVRAALDATIEAYKLTARTLADDLRAGRLSLVAWHLSMERVVKDVNLLSTAGAVGGWEQLRASQSALGRAGREIRDQYKFLDGFAADVASGKQKLDGTLGTRALMYIEAARSTFERQRESMELAAGFDEERNVLHPADHCDGPTGCPAQTARGWVDTGTLVRIGDRPCLTRCRCTIERRQSDESARSTRRNAPMRGRDRARATRDREAQTQVA